MIIFSIPIVSPELCLDSTAILAMGNFPVMAEGLSDAPDALTEFGDALLADIEAAGLDCGGSIHAVFPSILLFRREKKTGDYHPSIE
jgi:hypothetical protein